MDSVIVDAAVRTVRRRRSGSIGASPSPLGWSGCGWRLERDIVIIYVECQHGDVERGSANQSHSYQMHSDEHASQRAVQRADPRTMYHP